jgi:hypothetical protein
MKKKILQKSLLLAFTLLAFQFNAQTYTFSTDLEGWSTAYGAQGSNSGTVSHDATGGENGDGALLLTRKTNNSNFGLKPAGIDALNINYIRIKYKNLSNATSFRVQGKNDNATTDDESDDVALGRKAFIIDANKDEWLTLFMPVADISDWSNTVNDLDILVRTGYAEGEGNIIVDEIEFIHFDTTTTVSGFINNPGFEDGLGDITTWKPSTNKSYAKGAIYRGAANARTGDQSFKVEYQENPADAVAAYSIFSDERVNFGTGELFSDGSTLEAKVWVKSNVATDFEASVTFVFRDDITNTSPDPKDDVKKTVLATVSGSDGNWVELTFSHTIADGTTFNKVGLWFAITANPALAYPNVVYFDDFSSTLNGTVLSTENKSLEGVHVYPNPVSDRLHVHTLEGGTISIYNILGAKVLSTVTTSKNHTVDTSKIKSGVYVLKIASQGKSYTQKLIVR